MIGHTIWWLVVRDDRDRVLLEMPIALGMEAVAAQGDVLFRIVVEHALKNTHLRLAAVPK